MDAGKTTASLMGMNETVWQRHANPWSGWSRVPVLPVLALAIWSRTWIGWWCFLPIAVVLAWIWLNPRVFPAPGSTDNWMSKGVLGERVWLNRKAVPIPGHHVRMATNLSILASCGILPFIFGLVWLNAWATVAGLAIMMIAKLWFLDRMAWLFEEMKDRDKTYGSWLF